jgi:hypothetical protein
LGIINEGGTTLQIVKGAVRFRNRPQNTIERWINFSDGTLPPLPAIAEIHCATAEQIVDRLQEQLIMAPVPENRRIAIDWMQDISRHTERVSAAVALGEYGELYDVSLLTSMLREPIQLLRAAAIQGIARICERLGVPADGAALIAPLLDSHAALRDYAWECLLGQGWLCEWIANAPATDPQGRFVFLSGSIQDFLCTSQIPPEEKYAFLQKCKQEGGIVITVLDDALQMSIQKTQSQIDKCRQALRGLGLDPIGGLGMQIQFSQIKEHKKLLKSLQIWLDEISRI